MREKLKDSLGYRKIPVYVGEMRNSRVYRIQLKGLIKKYSSGISFSETNITGSRSKFEFLEAPARSIPKIFSAPSPDWGFIIFVYTHTKSTTEFYLSKNCLHINSNYNHYIYFYQWHPFISSTEIPFYFIVLAYQALSSLRIVTIRNLLSGRPTFR